MFNLQTIGPLPPGATPIDEDDLHDLIPQHVATLADLNSVEYDNIIAALPWARSRALRGTPSLLTVSFALQLHKRMFCDVWRWAGSQRRRQTNIGVAPAQIATQLKQTLDDAAYWHTNAVFTSDERAARIHHRLVAVHPFANGNGRWSRLFADLSLIATDQPAFTWGAGHDPQPSDDQRASYLSALRAADQDDYAPLVAFVRS